MAQPKGNFRMHDALVSALSPVQATGSFATRGILSQRDSNIDVGLTVKGVGQIKLPLEPDDADRLKAKAQLALSERDEESIPDSNVWEIDAADITFAKQSLWDAWMGRMVSAAKRNLGIEDNVSIAVDPGKLVLSEKDSTVETLPESQNPHHVATLVISLRSNHQGGNVRISHAGQTKNFSTEQSSWARYQWFACYNNTEHEAKPLTFGVRLLLTYKLRLTNAPYLIRSENDLLSMRTSLKDVLGKWTGKPYMLWYLLGHKYSNDELRQKSFKQNDAIRVTALETVATELGFTLLFGQIEKRITLDYLRGDNEETLSARHLTNMDGTEHRECFPITQDEVAQTGRYLEYPDEVRMDPYEDYLDISDLSDDEDRWATYKYHNSAVLMVPPQNLFALRVRHWASFEGSHKRLIYLKKQLAAFQTSDVGSIDPSIRQVLQILVDDNQDLEAACDDYEDDVQPYHRKALLSGMRLFGTEAEFVAILALELGLIDIFRQACHQLAEDRWRSFSQLPKVLADRIYRVGSIEEANIYMNTHSGSLPTGQLCQVKACDKILEAYEEVKASGVAQASPALNIDQWRRLWYREAVGKWHQSTDERSGISAFLHFPDLVFVGFILGDTSGTLFAKSRVELSVTSGFHVNSNHVKTILQRFVHHVDSMGPEIIQQHANFILGAMLNLKEPISVYGSNLAELADLSGTIGGSVPPTLLRLLRVSGSDLPQVVTIARRALKHKSWHRHLPRVLDSAVKKLAYKKKKPGWSHWASEDTVRSEYNGYKVGATIAELKLLTRIIQTLKLGTLLSKLWDELADLKELDLDVFTGLIPDEELKMMKAKRAEAE